MGRLSVPVAALAIVVARLLLPAGASAHDGHQAGSRLTVTQGVGPYPLTVTIEPPAASSGPLFVDVAADGPIADGTLLLSAVPFGALPDDAWQASVPLGAGDTTPRTIQLAVDGAGDWELLLRAEGRGGSGDARLPFTVAAPPRSLASTLFRGGLAALGLFLAATIVAVGLGPRPWLPAWLPSLLGPVAGVQQVAAPSVDLPPDTSTAGGRPHVNAVLRTEPAAPRAGEPMTLAFDLSDGATGRPVDDLVSHHQALVHGVLVGDDGGSFAHVHPARVAPGRFAVSLTPDRAGPYTFYAEIARRDGGTQVVGRPLVAGPESPPPTPAPPPTGLHELDGLAIEGSATPAVPRAGEPVALTFRVLRDGRPLPALEPWLGMAGHLLVRSADGAVFAHVHAAGSPLDAGAGSGDQGVGAAGEALGLRGEAPAAPTGFGPEVGFGYVFPAPGDYRLWLQVKVDGRVLTLPLAVAVQPADGGSDG